MRMVIVPPKVPARGYESPYREKKIAARTTKGGKGKVARVLKRKVAALALILLLAGNASAGSYAITTTPEQDAALTHFLEGRGLEQNKRRLTPQEHLQRLADRHLYNLTDEHRQAKPWQDLDAKEREARCAALKISPCPPGKK